MRTALITITHGRHAHLRRQHHAARSQSRTADNYICVTMGDRTVPRLSGLQLLPIQGASELPLAAARNCGARAAISAAADLLIFLDVDCIPGENLVAAYTEGARAADPDRPTVFCGPVLYLPPMIGATPPEACLAALAEEHPQRRFPDSRRLDDYTLFWSLSFALTTESWRAIGGFCESYTGYGAEDTDFGQLLRVAKGELRWQNDARAYHQHHESHDPPIQHIRSVIRNAQTFHTRWGWYPMLTWLAEFERRGLASRDSRGAWKPVE
jgi:GT2 family glycosyltransferase